MPMRCCICSEVAKTEEDLRVHVTVRHVRYIPLECHHCDHVFLPTLHALTRHYRMMHPDKLPVAVATISYDAEKATEVEKLVKQSQSNTDDVKSAAEPTPTRRKRQPQTQRLQKSLKFHKKEEKSVKTQEDVCNEFVAIREESSQTNVGEPNQDKRQNQLKSWFDERNGNTTQRTEEDHSNSMIESETENEMSSLMETTNDINQEDAEKAEGNQNVSTLKSEVDENGTTDDEVVDQQLYLNLYIDEESNVTEEQPDQPLNLDNGGQVKTQKTTEIELSDNESEKDNSIFAFAPVEENDHDAVSSPLIASTNQPAAPSLLSSLFREETGVSTSKDRRGRKHYISKDCALCGKTSFKQSDKRELHIWNVHMPMNRYGCRLCPPIRTSRFGGIQQHINRYHVGDSSVMEDAKLEVLNLYNTTRQKAFPSYAENEKPLKILAFESEEEDEKNQDDGGKRTGAKRTSTPAPVLTAEDEMKGENHNSSLIKNEAANEMNSLMETANDIINEHHDQEKTEKDDSNDDNASKLESETEEVEATEDEDTPMDLKLYIDEESVTTEEQPPDQANGQCISEIEHSDNESEKDNSLFAFEPPEENDHDRVSSPQITSTSPPALNPLEGTAASASKGRRGPKTHISQDCALCGKTSFKRSDQRELHIWSAHMPLGRYGCRLCPQIRMSRSDLIQNHVHRNHAGDESVIEDAKMEVLDLYNATRQEAFSLHAENKTEEEKKEKDQDEGGKGTSTPAPVLIAEDVVKTASASPSAPMFLRSATPPTTHQQLSAVRRRSEPKGMSKDCALCGKKSILQAQKRQLHIWSAHMPLSRFGCRLCPQLRKNRLKLIQHHISRYHPGELNLVTPTWSCTNCTMPHDTRHSPFWPPNS